MRLSHSSSIAALLMAFICGGCSRSSQNRSPQPSPQTASHQQSSSSAATQKTATGQYPFTAADVHFMSGMIGHHAQALVMAGWAPSHGASQSVRTLCQRIINAQTDEITLMQQWLRDRQQPVPEASAKGMKMVMDGVEHTMLMPGML